MTLILGMLCHMVVSVIDSVAIVLEFNSLQVDVPNLVNCTENIIMFSVTQFNLLPKTSDCNFVLKM